jgi:hypothetical protein
MMRRFFIPTILLGSALLIATQWASAAAPRRETATKCSSGHSRVVVADAQAQVYEAPESSSANPEYLVLFGCTYGRHRSYLLGHPLGGGTPSGIGGVAHETLAGTIIAYERSSTINEGRSSWLVIVRDLRSGRVLREVPTGTALSRNPNLVGAGFTTAIVVKSDGAVAWINETILRPGEKLVLGFEVHAVDSTGSRVLASGPEIERHSLALVGSTLYWMQGGKPMSAVLH